MRVWSSLTGLVAATAVIAACSGGPAGSQVVATSTPRPLATSTAGAQSTSYTFDMCALVPNSDVTPIANYPIPFDKSEGPTNTACAYYWSGDHEAASITLGADAYPTAQEITSGIMQTVNDYKLDGWPTEQLNGVGDEAWWVCQTEPFGECTLYVRQATYEVSVQTTPSEQPPIDNDKRKGVAIALANTVLDRLP